MKFIPKPSGNGQAPHPYRSGERRVSFSKLGIAPLCWDFPAVSVAGSVTWFLQGCEELGKYHCSDFGCLALAKYQSYLKSSLPSLKLCHLEASWLRELFAWAKSNPLIWMPWSVWFYIPKINCAKAGEKDILGLSNTVPVCECQSLPQYHLRLALTPCL